MGHMGHMDLAAIRERQEDIKVEARELIAEMTDDISADKAKALEAKHDKLMDEWDRLDKRAERLEKIEKRETNAGDPRRPIGEDGEVGGQDGERIDRSASPEVWRDKDGREVRVYRPGEVLAKRSGAGVSFGGMAAALVRGPRNEAEKRALAEGTDSAGGYSVPEPIALEFFDRLRANSVVMESGALTVPMQSETLQIVKVVTDPTFGFRAENAAITDADMTFGRVLFTAKSCTALVKTSRELIEDSVNVEQALLNAFAKAGALEIDRVALEGSGASNEPTGILNTAGINSVVMDTNGAAFTNWDKWLDALYELELDNVPGPYASVMHPRTARDLRKLKTGLTSDNTPLLMPEALRGIPQRITTQLPIDETQGTAVDASSVILGNFSNLMVGVRSSLRIELLKERYADNFQYGFLAHMRLDVQVRHPAAFCRIQGVIPA